MDTKQNSRFNRQSPARLAAPTLVCAMLAAAMGSPNAKAISIGTTEYATLELALAAYVANDVIDIGPTDTGVLAVDAGAISGKAINFEAGTQATLLISLQYEPLSAANPALPLYNIGGITVIGNNDPVSVWEVLNVTGTTADKFKLFWSNQDAKYYQDWPNQHLTVNAIGVHIGNLYVDYLNGEGAFDGDGDGAPILDIVQTKVSGTPTFAARQQSLHDNILANLGNAAIASRFGTNPDNDPRSDSAKNVGSRPEHSGMVSAGVYTHANAKAALAWDLANGLDYFDTLPAVFGNTIAVGANLFTTLASALAAADPDATVRISAGNFTQSSTLNLNKNGLTLQGAGRDQTTITSASSGYGILWTGNDITVQDLSVKGPSADAGSSYGLKIQPPGGASAAITGVNISNVTVYGSGRAEIDLHYVDGALISNTTADGQGTKGAGIAMTVSRNIALIDVTTAGNLWGSVAVYTKPSQDPNYFPNDPDTSELITVTNLSASEDIKLFGEGSADSPTPATRMGTIPGLVAPQFTHAVKNTAYRLDGENFLHYRESAADALAFAVGLNAVGPNTASIVRELQGNGIVLGAGLSIQTAIDAALSGSTLTVPAGTYVENLTITKPLTISGAGATTIIGAATGNAISIAGNTHAVIDGVTIENLRTVRPVIALSNAVPAAEYDTTNITLRNLTIDAADFGIGLFDVDGATVQNVVINGHVSTSVGALELVGVRGLAVTGLTVAGVSRSLKIFEAAGYAPNGSVSIAQSKLSSIEVVGDTATVSATSNWWGSPASPATRIIGAASFAPWYIDAALTTTTSVAPPPSVCASGCEFTSIQEAIDNALDGDTIHVKPGTYVESANYNSANNTNSGTNPVGLLINKSLSIIGVNGAGNPVTDRQDAQAIIQSGVQSNWGTNFFVTAPDVTISGLTLLGTAPGATVNKVVEVIEDNFTIEDSVISSVSGKEIASAVYINDRVTPLGGPSAIASYAIVDSDLYGLVSITNGPGVGHASDALDMRIVGNRFLESPYALSWGNEGIFVTGNDDRIAWRNAAAALPTEITGNDFTAADNILLVRGDDTQDFPSAAFIANLVGNNSLGTYAYATDAGNPATVPYTVYDGGYTISAFSLDKAIQPVVTAAESGNVVHVGAGSYVEDITITRPLTLAGTSGAVLTGQININAAGATVAGLEVTNPTGINGIVVNGAGSIVINNNNIHDIGTLAPAAEGRGIYVVQGSAAFGNIVISNNTLTNIGRVDGTVSSKGIWLGHSSAAHDLSDVTIQGNIISNVIAASTKGSNGIQVNYGSSGTAAGRVVGLSIANNVISNLSGGWVHAIGLEADTVNTTVTGNTIHTLDETGAGSDEAGIFIQDNPSASTLVITNNNITGATQGIASHFTMSALAVNAERNYWGGSAPTVAGPAAIDFDPWWTSSAMANATQLSDYVAPTPPPPPPVTPEAPTPQQVESIIDTIVIPPAGSGESISEAVIEVVNHAATATTALATNIVENIATVNTTAAIEALTTISSVVNVSGNAAASTVAGGNATGAAATVASGTTALNSFSTLLAAIDTKANDTAAPVVLTPVQKTAVQQATVQAAASVVKMLTAAPAPAEKKVVLESLGKIISSNVNLGVPLTTAQANTLLDAADQATSQGGDADSQLDTSIPIKPQNKELISKELLTVALEGSGITATELDIFLAELAQAINPADVNVGNTNGEQALASGFSGALGDTTTSSISFDSSTGVTSFTIGGGGTTAQSLNGRTLQAVTVARTIPGRVISSNVVASSFPDGIRVRGNGSVVITNSRIASIVVPASYDPINFYADLRKLGLTAIDSLGNVTIDDGGSFHFSGTFDYVGVASGVGGVASTALVAPTGKDETDPGFIYKVTYRDGSTQNIQPYLIEDNFVDSVRSRGLEVSTDRNSGVITVSGRRFRPSYFVDDHDSSTLAFWNSKKDASGLAYQPVDVNADGVLDYRVISETGYQVAYGL